MDFTKIRNYLFLGLLGAVTILFFYILQPFAYPIFWAAIVAALFYPLYQRLNSWLNHPNLSATIILVAVIVVILVPLVILGTLLLKEAVSLYGTLSSSGNLWNSALERITNFFKYNSYNAQLHIDENFWGAKFSEVGQNVLGYIFTWLTNLTQNSLVLGFMFITMLYTLFFFVRDGEKILKKLLYLSPLGDKYEIMLYNKFTVAASAIIKGTIILGGIQGAIGGIIFAVTGIQGALIWAIIMTLCSIIPGVGSALIWLPAGIIMLLTGNIWQGIAILVVGTVVISTVDNMLRPLFVGRRLDMHPLVILFSTLGGLALFGISGFMVGPIIAALFLSFWEMYEEFYKTELKNN
ncbi:MAG: AI-2E family transporter [Candidatus Magasanikbacteria bacterium]|nr:AI-2E family transporter [Candidatus Magasanikbacteria bacterium]